MLSVQRSALEVERPFSILVRMKINARGNLFEIPFLSTYYYGWVTYSMDAAKKSMLSLRDTNMNSDSHTVMQHLILQMAHTTNYLTCLRSTPSHQLIPRPTAFHQARMHYIVSNGDTLNQNTELSMPVDVSRW